MTHTVAQKQLIQSLIQRVENVQAEIDALNDGKKEIWAEMRAAVTMRHQVHNWQSSPLLGDH